MSAGSNGVAQRERKAELVGSELRDATEPLDAGSGGATAAGTGGDEEKIAEGENRADAGVGEGVVAGIERGGEGRFGVVARGKNPAAHGRAPFGELRITN